MKVSSTELQNNFGKYLMLAGQEDIIITRNGLEIARLSALRDTSPDEGVAPDMVAEKAERYSFGSYGGGLRPMRSLCN